jgi:para-nitrobenzyl esterase
MKINYLFILLLFLNTFCSEKKAPADVDPVVKTSLGFISGIQSGDLLVFKGVPFAEPPVGELRWKEPMPKTPWGDTLVCTKFSASPMQNEPKPFFMWSQEFIAPATPLSEDCLYLNVWTPATKPDKKLPVLVWIYGGGFNSGSAACPIYDGEALAKDGIVYVSINYRVGVFGFLAHPELTAESPNKSSGNYGILDQVEALRWIYNNIAAFGGDPERVTIAGQSAGSFSVQALVATPLTKKLFRGAIAQSGAMTGGPGITLNEAEQIGIALMPKLGGTSIASLRALSADTIQARGAKVPFGRLYPVMDGYLFPTDIKSIFAEGQHNDVPVMAGWVTGDADLVMGDSLSPEKFREIGRSMFADNITDFNKLFPATSPQVSVNSQKKLAVIRFAAYPDYQWLTNNHSKSFMYEFSYVPTDKPGFPNYGAFHTSEVPFALHTLSKWDRPWQETDYAVQKYMTAYWVNFVKTGNPNGSGLPEWKHYDKSEGFVMQLGKQPELQDRKYLEEFRFLDSFN